ncbi:MAG: arginine deiminase family protein [Cytophagales bacterium]|nr:arginine deiminase family protein [Bernardetiaceae bacterium]MDW8211683.1 arginine deiminase family protein [Cytophagales bacterium]
MIHVDSEIATLKRLIIHSPDSGLGKVVPSKAQDWLFEDIVHLKTMRKEEYDYYIKLLLYFLDPEKVRGKLAEIDHPKNQRNFYKPEHPHFHASDKVMDIEYLLGDILEDIGIRREIVASIAALEQCSFGLQQTLLKLSPRLLAKTIISGALPDERMIFAPVPNFIFTRDIGVTINNHILLNRPAKEARRRESFIARYVFYYHPAFESIRENIIEIADDEQFFLLDGAERENRHVTLEGGDIMMVAPNHLLIGVSERTSPHAANKIIQTLFERKVVEKISVIRIPPKRDFMHIDTVFTQVKRNVWVLYGKFSKRNLEERDLLEKFYKKGDENKIRINQFIKGKSAPREFETIEDLLDEISQQDLHSAEPTQFIYSGNYEFPYSLREQWTDSCNLLALKEGVVIGYDRNDKTAEAFARHGFRLIKAADLLEQFEKGLLSPDTLTDTLIMLPSAELSRARGGSHCMSMPLLRDNVFAHGKFF